MSQSQVQSHGDRSIFQRTRMCKFHLLGCCQDGENCAYAHAREEMQPRPDLFRTKLCKTLIKNGECTDPSCKFAHNKTELRSSGTLRRSLAAPTRQGKSEDEHPIENSSSTSKVTSMAVPPGALTKATSSGMRPVLVVPQPAKMQVTGTASGSSATPTVSNSTAPCRVDSGSRNTQLHQSSIESQRQEYTKLLHESARPNPSTSAENLDRRQRRDDGMQETPNLEEKWTALQANLAQHQEKIQKHCDEVHALVMERAGSDPRYGELKRLQIPPIKAHSVSSNSAAVLEHITNTFERITILEAYIKAHGDLITNIPVSSGMTEPLRVEHS